MGALPLVFLESNPKQGAVQKIHVSPQLSLCSVVHALPLAHFETQVKLIHLNMRTPNDALSCVDNLPPTA